MHPSELLPDYLLELLDEDERREVERHLEGCARCRAKLHSLSEALAQWVESLPAPARAPDLWPGIVARLPARSQAKRARAVWQSWLLAASLLVGALGLGWGLWQESLQRQLSAERQKVAGWLSREDVRVLTLPELDGQRFGSVLLLPDGRALFVLREPPAARLSYQAWGHRGDERVSLGLTQGTLLEVRYEGFEFVGVSLEPVGGSPQPTKPLGRVPVS